MAKKRLAQPQDNLLARIWRGSGPYRGPALSAAGIALFVTQQTALQIGGIALMLIGGWLIGQWFTTRQRRRDADKVIQRRFEKKQARKAARAARLADTDEEDEEEI